MIFCTDARIHSCTVRASRSARMMDCALRKKHSCNAPHESLFPLVRNPRIEHRATVFGEAFDNPNPSVGGFRRNPSNRKTPKPSVGSDGRRLGARGHPAASRCE
jgi:hypothetical protein